MLTFLVHLYCFGICKYNDLKNCMKQFCIYQMQMLKSVLVYKISIV